MFYLNFENSKTCVSIFKADLLIFKCLQGTTIPDFACCSERVNHNNGTRRNKTTLRIPRVRTEAAKKSFWFQGLVCFNELPIDIRVFCCFQA